MGLVDPKHNQKKFSAEPLKEKNRYPSPYQNTLHSTIGHIKKSWTQVFARQTITIQFIALNHFREGHNIVNNNDIAERQALKTDIKT